MRYSVLFAALAFASNTLSVPAAEPPKAEGGSTQVSAQDGCMNQWLFNGVWRVRVTNVAFQPKGDLPNAWAVTMQWGNGTNYGNITPAVDTLAQDMVLALQNGDTLTATDTTTGNLTQQKLFYHSFPQSGQYTHTQPFYSTSDLDQNNKPAKLLITFDVAKYKQYHATDAKFWKQKTRGYNYRVNLDCSK